MDVLNMINMAALKIHFYNRDVTMKSNYTVFKKYFFNK